MLKIKQTASTRLGLVVLFVSIYSVAAGVVMAQSDQSTRKRMDKQPIGMESNVCPPLQIFTYGTAARKFNICISDHGNIRKLEFPGAIPGD